jgi:hypothetical protein
MTDDDHDTLNRGDIWFAKHEHHVRKLLDTFECPAVPPSGSDRLNPALWKNIHWRWYMFYRDTYKLS